MSLRITGKPLSQGNEGEDVAQVHVALRALGRMVPVDELGARVFGTGTAATVRALQGELGVDVTGVVDPRTAAAIDAALGRARTTERMVRGTVLDDEGRPLGGGSVSVSLQRPGGVTSLGAGEIADDGTYQVRYVVPRGDAGPVDLRVVAADAAGPLETVPSGASVVTDAGQLEVIDLVAVRRADARGRSELDVMIADVSALTGGRDLADLHEGDGKHEVSLLATQSGYATAQVATLVRAHQLARETGVPAAVFHGLLRGGMPSTLEALLATDSAQRAAALEASVASGLVPARVDGRLLGELLDGVRPAPTAADALTELLGDQLDAAERAAFVAMYFERAGDPAGFWTAVKGDARWQGRAERLQLAVQLGALTNHRVPLVKSLLASGAIERASDVARISDAAWRELVVANGGAPPETPGATAEEQVGRYVSQITLQVEAAFATRVVAARLGDTPVARFLEAHPAYDLERTYPDRFFAEDATAAGALTAEARADLLAIQRLYRLTASAAETIVLANQGVRSALQIARIDRDVFATQVADTYETARAHELHAEASRVTATAVALFGEYTTRADRTGLRALPRVDTEQQAELAAAAIPNWETLFGSHDLCACDACASAHGVRVSRGRVAVLRGAWRPRGAVRAPARPGRDRAVVREHEHAGADRRSRDRDPRGRGGGPAAVRAVHAADGARASSRRPARRRSCAPRSIRRSSRVPGSKSSNPSSAGGSTTRHSPTRSPARQRRSRSRSAVARRRGHPRCGAPRPSTSIVRRIARSARRSIRGHCRSICPARKARCSSRTSG